MATFFGITCVDESLAINESRNNPGGMRQPNIGYHDHTGISDDLHIYNMTNIYEIYR